MNNSLDQTKERLTKLYNPEEFEVPSVKVKNKWLVHPNSSFKIIWDLVIIVFAVYNALLVPYEFAYTLEK